MIPYHGLAAHVRATAASAAEQTYRPIEIVVVNDGSFGEEDWILAELAADYPLTVLSQSNAGLGAARNFGIGQSRGRYVLPLDADNVLEPLVERTVAILESDPASPLPPPGRATSTSAARSCPARTTASSRSATARR